MIIRLCIMSGLIYLAAFGGQRWALALALALLVIGHETLAMWTRPGRY